MPQKWPQNPQFYKAEQNSLRLLLSSIVFAYRRLPYDEPNDNLMLNYYWSRVAGKGLRHHRPTLFGS